MIDPAVKECAFSILVRKTRDLSANPCGLVIEMKAFSHRRGGLLKRFMVRVLPPALSVFDGARNGPEGPSGALLLRPAKC